MGVYIIHQILIQHILVFSFLLEKSIMDGVSFPWKFHPPLSTSFMSLSPSSTGFMVFGLLMSGISSCLTSINFWVPWSTFGIPLSSSFSFLLFPLFLVIRLCGEKEER